MITVFTTNTCGYCKQLKKYLAFKGADYTEVNLDKHPERRQEVFKLSGAMTVPITMIDNKVIIGYNLSKLSSML